MGKWYQRARRKREKVGRGVEGGERRVVEEAMKRPRDKKKDGERKKERERDGTIVVKWMRRAKKRREKKSDGERKRVVGIEKGEKNEGGREGREGE